MIKGFLNPPWFLWAELSLALAFVWTHIGTYTKMPASTGFHFFIIRWGHTLPWFFLRGIDPGLNGMANINTLPGGLMYSCS